MIDLKSMSIQILAPLLYIGLLSSINENLAGVSHKKTMHHGPHHLIKFHVN